MSTTAPSYDQQPEQVQKICQVIGQFRRWTPEETWQKAITVANILKCSDPIEGLSFAFEAARLEAHDRKIDPDPFAELGSDPFSELNEREPTTPIE